MAKQLLRLRKIILRQRLTDSRTADALTAVAEGLGADDLKAILCTRFL